MGDTETTDEGMPDPEGEVALRTIAMPRDTNPAGDIFGGWLLSQMDLAAGMVARRRANSKCATIAIDAMKFHQPVMVGDELTCYAKIVRVGRTSMTIFVESWVRRYLGSGLIKVTEGSFTFVALDENRRPKPVDNEVAPVSPL